VGLLYLHGPTHRNEWAHFSGFLLTRRKPCAVIGFAARHCFHVCAGCEVSDLSDSINCR
jgi:hypothetical protein